MSKITRIYRLTPHTDLANSMSTYLSTTRVRTGGMLALKMLILTVFQRKWISGRVIALYRAPNYYKVTITTIKTRPNGVTWKTQDNM